MPSLLGSLCPSWFAGALAWAALGACIDAPPAPGPAAARLVTTWDPLACGEPHRIVIELEDDGGIPISASTPCKLGGLTVDVSHLGGYRGQIYAWALAAPIRSVTPIELTIDEPIVHWHVETPR
jgi:hypothetical protein